MILYSMKIQYEKICEVVSCKVQSPADIVPALKEKMQDHPDQEQFLVALLNGSNEIMGLKLVTLGLVNQTQIHPRECFKPAVLASAVSVIVAHNHPSGNQAASAEDIAVTKKLCEAGEILGIPVLDHIIVSENGWASIRATHPSIF